jgi:hypothetical protein
VPVDKRSLQNASLKSTVLHIILTLGKNIKEEQYTAPKDSANFVTNNYGAGRLFSLKVVSIIDSWRPAFIVIRNEIRCNVYSRKKYNKIGI